MLFLAKIVIAEKLPNATNVPNTPNNRMFFIFPKKSPLYMLKPEANTMGGRQK